MLEINRENLKNPIYLRTIGLKVLEENLGSVGTAMFLQQFDLGNGDYTKERGAVLSDQTIQAFEWDLQAFNEEKGK